MGGGCQVSPGEDRMYRLHMEFEAASGRSSRVRCEKKRKFRSGSFFRCELLLQWVN